MSGKRKRCKETHRFQEHKIGAGLTRKVCVLCGALEIGQGRRTVLAEGPWAEESLSELADAS